MLISPLNELIADEFILQSIDIEKLKASFRKNANESFKEFEQNILRILLNVDPTQGNQQIRLNNTLDEFEKYVQEFYEEQEKIYRTEMLAFLLFLRERPRKILEKSLGFSLFNRQLKTEDIKQILNSSLIEGASVREWWNRQETLTNQRIADTIRKGLMNGDELSGLVAAVRGTARNNFKDGIMVAIRRDAEAVVSTSVQKLANDVLLATYRLNSDVIKVIQQKSTLDARTTDVCKAYSGLTWDVVTLKPEGHNLPFNGGTPRHWRCRSVIIPVTKSFSELEETRIESISGSKLKGVSNLLEKQAIANGLSKIEIDRLKIQTQASMDGQVPSDLNYEAWLNTKSVDFQKEVLGETKYSLWKKKKLSFKDLVDQQGDPLTVQELIKKHK